MREPSETALALARLRATRVVPRPPDAGTLRRLKAATARSGRVLIETRGTDGPGLTLGWQEGSEPAYGPETGVERRHASASVLLTFAACLGACWPDRDQEPYPGVPSSEAEVLAALAALDPARLMALGEDGSVGGAERHYKAALRQLRDAGLLDPDDKSVRLGPVVATWSRSDVVALRDVYDRLPAAPSQEGMR